MNDRVNYETRIICFLDILGFKELINSTIQDNGEDNEKNIGNLIKALTKFKDFSLINQNRSTKVTWFSDTLVFSFLISEESGVFDALLDIQLILADLVFEKILCRGGVAIGKLIHTEELLFGPALIDAYYYESKCAMYPRVIVPEEIISIGKKYHAKHHCSGTEERFIKGLIEKDFDGMYYIDYFRSIQSEFDEPHYNYILYLHELSKIIDKGLQSANPAIRIKYLWMKEKYNSVVKDIKSNLDNWNDDIEVKNAYTTLPIF